MAVINKEAKFDCAWYSHKVTLPFYGPMGFFSGILNLSLLMGLSESSLWEFASPVLPTHNNLAGKP
jgi:hypothetical protein